MGVVVSGEAFVWGGMEGNGWLGWFGWFGVSGELELELELAFGSVVVQEGASPDVDSFFLMCLVRCSCIFRGFRSWRFSVSQRC